MTHRMPRRGDLFIIRAARDADGRPIPHRWLLSVDGRFTDDTVALPRVYFRPKPTRLGIEREVVLQQDSPRVPPLKFDSWSDAIAAVRAIQHRIDPLARARRRRSA